MDFQIIERENDVTYEIPSVSFPAFEEYMEKASAIAKYIGSLEVNEENVKDTKKTLADARRLTERLTEERIRMKKDLLQNFTTFENQVKEIIKVVDDADKILRTKVKELEEAEREEKGRQIRAIWDKRIEQCPEITKIIPAAFDKWMNQKYLNKSVSMKTIEEEMIEWIRQRISDIKVVMGMGEDYIEAYGRYCDLARAITEVDDRKEYIENLNLKEVNEQIETATFTVYGTKDIALTERLLKENEIEYRKEK